MVDEPMLILCDDGPETANRLLKALRDSHGSSVEIFVLDHNVTHETIAVLLPKNAPSLAAALRDWAYEWWPAEKFATPEKYLSGFGVLIEPGEYTSFSTSCPYCSAADMLSVVGGAFQAMGVRIQADGFAFADAQMMQTDEEEILCSQCQRTFSADAIRL